MELFLNLTVDICNGVKERLGGYFDRDILEVYEELMNFFIVLPFFLKYLRKNWSTMKKFISSS